MPIQLTVEGRALILRFEVGGGPGYYEKYLSHPIYPGGQSGVTIGVGYDLGYNDSRRIGTDWGTLLPGSIGRLQTCSGIQGGPAVLAVLDSLRDVYVPWSAAVEVFERATVPRFSSLTEAVYPGVLDLLPNCQDALLSLVFNRGTKLIGPSRTEMLAIRDLVPRKDYRGIANQLILMKRVWVGTSIARGMANRRDAEADLVMTCVS